MTSSKRPFVIATRLALLLSCGAEAACSFGAPPPFFAAPPASGPQVPVFCYATLADAECHPTPQPGQEDRLTSIYQKDAVDRTSLDYWTSPETDELGNPMGPPRYRRAVTPAGKPINVPVRPEPRQTAPTISAKPTVASLSTESDAGSNGSIGQASRSAYTAKSWSPYALRPQTGPLAMQQTNDGTPAGASNAPRSLFTR